MSFGGGGFGSFGSNNNQSSGFGAFGAAANNNNSASAFGSANPGGFGQSANQAGGLFGSANTANNVANNTAGTAFGSPAGGFGSTAVGGFGSKPAFGTNTTSSGSSLFGAPSTNNASTSAFGGFGSTTNTTSSPFGGATASGGGLFGSGNKTGFGATASTTPSLFGTSNPATTSGFGSGGFGATNNPGLGVNIGDPPGTGGTPFQAYQEKEPNNQINSFQNITFQDPFKKWSVEELRMADYLQGRRHGNASGAGAFGVGSNFGGGFGSTSQTNNAFGSAQSNTSGGLFGSNNANSAASTSAFGQPAVSAFGSTSNTVSSGGLFGNANKSSGSVFGQPQAQQAGGIFGSSGGGFGAANANTSAFGASNNTTGGGGGGGVFGSNMQANKPQGSGLSIGNNSASGPSAFGSAASGGFGAPATSGTGLFGSANANQVSGGLFGSNQQQQQQTQQQNAPSGFGGGIGQCQGQKGEGLFGSALQKPASGGLFGSSTGNTNSGGLFGNANTQQQTLSAFGSTANNATTGNSLFGAPKPSTGMGIFGSVNPSSNTTTTGAFQNLGASNQNQQPTGSSLFGAPNSAQSKPSLFGTTNPVSGSSLFGAQNAQPQNSSPFGSVTNQQQFQNPSLGGSLLGNNQQASNAPQSLTAGLSDVSAYGSTSLFAGLRENEPVNPGPLAIPLNSNHQPHRSSIFPMYKLAHSNASRFSTPQKRGFGFSYSRYGTPGVSPASSISRTPGGFGRSVFGTSSGLALSKSVSTNNLRRSLSAEDSILAPGAFSSSSGARWYGSMGSKKLIINRDIKSDLFFTPQKDKQVNDSNGNGSARKLAKRVSFDTTNVDAVDGSPRKALPAPETASATPPPETAPQEARQSIELNGSKTPETEHVKSTELAVMHEEENTASPNGQQSTNPDFAPGEYRMKPSRAELSGMNRMQRQRIEGFTVGRENVGIIKFKVPVDISSIDIEDLCGNIIQLEPRSATVYPIQAKKPPMGKGLNVPAVITLEHSWPRGGRDRKFTNDPKRLARHVERLKRIPDTTFEAYDNDSGVWSFSVEHFTTYGLPDTDDEVDSDTRQGGGAQPLSRIQATRPDVDAHAMHEDTNPLAGSKGGIPGAFDENEKLFMNAETNSRSSFLGDGSADAAPSNIGLSIEPGVDSNSDDGYTSSDDEDTANSTNEQSKILTERDQSHSDESETQNRTPGGILRARMRAEKASLGPLYMEVTDGNDWTKTLRNTVSPIKRDRRLLRELNEDSPSRRNSTKPENTADHRKSSVWDKVAASPGKPSETGCGKEGVDDEDPGFSTSIDLMNSLFERPRLSQPSFRTSFGKKRDSQGNHLQRGDPIQALHNACPSSWRFDETLLISCSIKSRPWRINSDILNFKSLGIQTAEQHLRLAQFTSTPLKHVLQAQEEKTAFCLDEGVPMAHLKTSDLSTLFHHQETNNPANVHEKQVWELAGILFDRILRTSESHTEASLRKTKLSQFWTEIVEQASAINIGLAGTNEERAVACLGGHRVTESCQALLRGKNFRLGTLLPLIGTDELVKKCVKEQLETWRDSKMLSEFPETVRTMYELLSGNVCVCEGMKGGPIEDRMESFVISKKFGLDWRQSFGLRLWYAMAPHEDIEVAIEKYEGDVAQDKEDMPRPWYYEQGIMPLWNDRDSDKRQDLLWGLLRLYADRSLDLQAILRPENSQRSPLDFRLSWQLGLALVSTGKVTFGADGAEKADAATLSYAAQLTATGEWLESIFVLLHLNDAAARKRAIQEQLGRHAGLIGPETGDIFKVLTTKFLIPTNWVWEALALYMRSVQRDAFAEVHYLLRAESLIEAHRVLVQQVGPRAIIERDYANLSTLISLFSGQEHSISTWDFGGEVYRHFLSLVHHRKQGQRVPPSLLEKLLAGLGALSAGGGDSELVRYAAVADMADETAREAFKLASEKQDKELRNRVLNLPLTQDRRLAYAVDLGMKHYREVTSH